MQGLNKEENKKIVTMLQETHKLYDENIESWQYYRMSYEGGPEFIQQSLIQHPRESIENYKARLEKGICINYCQSIVDLFNFFLTDDPPLREIETINTNSIEYKRFLNFLDDADLNGNSYDFFLNETHRLSSVYGTMGILIDKPQYENDAKDESCYPYAAAYSPEAILDWEIERDHRTGRRYLTYLKLKDGEDYLLFWIDRWERWKIDIKAGEEEVAIKIASGINPLNEIAFIWLPNVRVFGSYNMGISDISDLSYIASSIIRDFSRADEILDIAGFPMMRMPMETEDALENETSPEITVSERSVLEFNPEFGDSAKPDWLESRIKEAIESILLIQDRKIEEAYRIMFLSGVYENRDKAQTKSATALRYQYQQLNALLIKKSKALIHADMKILQLFFKWQNISLSKPDIKITRPEDFALGALVESLANAVTGLQEIKSKTFRFITKKNMINLLHPNLSEKDYNVISEELKNEVALEESALIEEEKLRITTAK